MATRGSSHCYERPADHALRSRPAVAGQAANDVDDQQVGALADLEPREADCSFAPTKR